MHEYFDHAIRHQLWHGLIYYYTTKLYELYSLRKFWIEDWNLNFYFIFGTSKYLTKYAIKVYFIYLAFETNKYQDY